MILWRIGSTTRSYSADDLTGAGAAKDPGRWNDNGQNVLYAAQTLSLAVLETAAHIDESGLPLNRYVIEISVPDEVWATSRLAVSEHDLPVGWNAIPAGQQSIAFGSHWFNECQSAILHVPSVIVPEERIAVVNCKHPLADRLAARAVRRYEYSSLFRR
jgi:RES domain-containing protein